MPVASTYTDEKGERICDAFASSPGSLREVFNARDDLPDLSTVYDWEDKYPAFAERLARARQRRAHLLIESAMEVADAGEGDTITATARDGSEYQKADHEWINRSRLRVETKLRIAKAFNPGAYGDRTQTTGSMEIRYRIHRGPKPE